MKTAIGSGGDDNDEPKGIYLIRHAQEEARRLGHNFVGTEVILLGALHSGAGIAYDVLTKLDIELEDARTKVEAIIGKGNGFVAQEIPFTPRAKRALELSWDEARQLGHNYIDTEHILLGLIREPNGTALRVIEQYGITKEQIRKEVMHELQQRGNSL